MQDTAVGARLPGAGAATARDVVVDDPVKVLVDGRRDETLRSKERLRYRVVEYLIVIHVAHQKRQRPGGAPHALGQYGTECAEDAGDGPRIDRARARNSDATRRK